MLATKIGFLNIFPIYLVLPMQRYATNDDKRLIIGLNRNHNYCHITLIFQNK